MSNEITILLSTGQSVYAIIQNTVGQVYNGTTFVSFNATNWPTYAITLTDAAGVGMYQGNFPVIAAGAYYVYGYVKAGLNPASTDVGYGPGAMQWDGTKEVTLGTVAIAPAGLAAIIPESHCGGLTIDLRQAIGLIFDAACYGRMNGLPQSPLGIQSPDGTINRANISFDQHDNRTGTSFVNLP